MNTRSVSNRLPGYRVSQHNIIALWLGVLLGCVLICTWARENQDEGSIGRAI